MYTRETSYYWTAVRNNHPSHWTAARKSLSFHWIATRNSQSSYWIAARKSLPSHWTAALESGKLNSLTELFQGSRRKKLMGEQRPVHWKVRQPFPQIRTISNPFSFSCTVCDFTLLYSKAQHRMGCNRKDVLVRQYQRTVCNKWWR